jgi:hypothetical protein
MNSEPVYLSGRVQRFITSRFEAFPCLCSAHSVPYDRALAYKRVAYLALRPPYAPPLR